MTNVALAEAHLGYSELKEIAELLENMPNMVVFNGDLTIYDEAGDASVVGVHYDADEGYHYIVAKNGLEAED